MSKRRKKRGESLANQLEGEELPTPEKVEAMFSEVEPLENKISEKEEKKKSRKLERKKFGTQLRPDLIRKIKIGAAQRGMNLTSFLEKVLDDFFEEGKD